MKQHRQILVLILFTLGSLSYSACKKEEAIKLKIMSYNIHHGEGMDTILDLSRIAGIIRSVDPDLCGLQEVDEYCTRTDSVGQTEYLAQSTAMKGTFGIFMDFQKGEYGMATLTKKPIISSKVLRLPDALHEPRSSIVHEVKLSEACVIAFANVHFDWIGGEEGSANRLKQAKVLTKYLDSLNHATIITGDFNCTPDSPTMTYFKEQGFEFVDKGNDKLSFQGNTKSEIDHLIFRDLGPIKFIPKNIYLMEEPVASDHRPLIVELEVSF